MSSWTPEMDALIVANWDKSAHDIAAIIGGDMTKNGVISRSRRIGMPRKAPPPRPKAATVPKERLIRVKPRLVPKQPPVAEIADGPVPFMLLEEWHCREIVGRGADGLSLSCGRLKTPVSSYCPKHSRKNYDGVKR